MVSKAKYIVLLCVLVVISAKTPHEKTENNSKDNNSKLSLNVEWLDNEKFNENERFARHVSVVTESVIEHLIQEIKREFHANPSPKAKSALMKFFKRDLNNVGKKNIKVRSKNITQPNNGKKRKIRGKKRKIKERITTTEANSSIENKDRD